MVSVKMVLWFGLSLNVFLNGLVLNGLSSTLTNGAEPNHCRLLSTYADDKP